MQRENIFSTLVPFRLIYDNEWPSDIFDSLDIGSIVYFKAVFGSNPDTEQDTVALFPKLLDLADNSNQFNSGWQSNSFSFRSMITIL